MAGKVVPFRMGPDQARSLVNRLAQDSSNVVLTRHAKDKMTERGRVRKEMDEVLRQGILSEGPAPSVKGGEEGTMIRRVAGQDITVVVVIDDDRRRLWVKTVY